MNRTSPYSPEQKPGISPVQVRHQTIGAAVRFIEEAVLFGTHENNGQPVLGKIANSGVTQERPVTDIASKTAVNYPIPRQEAVAEAPAAQQYATPDEAERQRQISEAREQIAQQTAAFTAQAEAVRQQVEQEDKDSTFNGVAA